MGNKLNSSYEGLENNKVKVNYYWMEGCGHFEEFNDEWNKFENITKNHPDVTLTKIESQSNNIPTEHQNMIEGYPTVILEKKNGDLILYNGKRTQPGLSAWLNNFVDQ